ncbi:rRNA methyltransferase mitochondrial [Chlorella sorokiniana]|uniref:rRNA methyltransferase 1, mitochondrial n=1 Tax=Chlorella sorokiniana TaxID=3076 RepID=A0A2P6TF62_CHLSO|nr:rRNA methyltransferase mitochondrial [Chlorella sorokiniana]|eukprot:PRW32608.1 rRNA methyltransferase mitochondrial [Chlorella sorokiniana]
MNTPLLQRRRVLLLLPPPPPPPKRAILVLASVLLAFIAAVHCQIQFSQTDVAALLAQRRAISNWDAFAAANSITGWDATTPVCDWTGIACKANSTTANKFDINLSCAPIGRLPCTSRAQGTLAPELGGLRELSGSQLRGPVPAGWGAPGAFPALRYLVVDGNQLTGSLPSSWGQPGSSQTYRLDLSSNRLSGTLPPEWGAQNVFPQLEFLLLDNNRLSGPLPPSWAGTGALASLRFLDLHNNALTGTVPELWQKSQQLATSPPSPLAPVLSPPQPSPPVVADPPPSELPPPAQTQAPSSSSSSAPIGVIAGSVAAAAAVAGVLAFLALRPGKGWLRGRRQRPLAPTSTSFTKQRGEKLGEEGADTFVAGGKEEDTFITVARASQAPVASQLEPVQSAYRAGKPASLPASYATSSPSQLLDSDGYLQGINTLLHNAPASMLAVGQSGRAVGGTASGGLDQGLPIIHPELQRWVFNWSELTVRQLLGRGSFGRVYLATWRATPVAAKVLLADEAALTGSAVELNQQATTRQLLAEAQVMSAMRHPNLVTFMGVCLLPPCILTEHCSQGSLYGVLRQGAQDPGFAAQLTWRRRLGMACDAARGLLYLHVSSPPIVHSDVKSPNVLVDHNWNAKVCDFNLSAFTRGPAGSAVPSNPRWLAPEVLQGERATSASDTFAFAVLLWELLTWQLPWGGMDPFQIRRAVLAGMRPELPPFEALPGAGAASMTGLDAYCRLMRACWASDPRQRPGLEPVGGRWLLMQRLCPRGGRQSLRSAVVAAYEQQRGAGSRARGGGGGGGGRWGGDRQRGGRKEEDSTSIWGNDWDLDAAAEPAGRSGGSLQDREERSGSGWRGGEERGGGGWRGGEERSGGSWRGGEERSGGGWRGGEERSGGGSWRNNEERGGGWRGGDRQRSDRRGDSRGEGWGSRDRRGRGGDHPQQRYGGDRSQQRYGGDRGERRDRWQPREQQAAGRPAWNDAEGAEGGWAEGGGGGYGASDPAAAPGGLRQFWIGDVLYGVSPVLAALQAGRREVHTLYLQDGMDLSKRKDKGAIQAAKKRAEELGAKVEYASKHDLNMVADNRPHQGVVLDCSPLEFEPLPSLPDAPEGPAPSGRLPVWLCLDEVMDPQNFGAALRSAYFLGVDGVLTCHRNSAPLSAAVSKASAGAMELVPVHACKSLPQTLADAKERGWQVLGAAAEPGALPAASFVLQRPAILVMGNEGYGLRGAVRRLCDAVLQIEDSPGRHTLVDSLNVSVATGILLHRLLTAQSGTGSLAASAAGTHLQGGGSGGAASSPLRPPPVRLTAPLARPAVADELLCFMPQVDSPHRPQSPLGLPPLAASRRWPSNEALVASDAEIAGSVDMSDLPLSPRTPPASPVGLAQAFFDLMPQQRLARDASIDSAGAAAGGGGAAAVPADRAAAAAAAAAEAEDAAESRETPFAALKGLLCRFLTAAATSGSSIADLAATNSGSRLCPSLSRSASVDTLYSARSSSSELSAYGSACSDNEL